MPIAKRPWEEAYRRQGRLWRGSRLDPLTLRFLDEGGDAPGARWLDAGCADAKGLSALVERVSPARVIGADRSIWGLRRARERLPTAAPRLLRADVRAWPFPDAAFDVVRAVHLFGHLNERDRSRAYAECARILRPGAPLLAVDFGTGDFRNGTGSEVEPASFRRGHGIVTHYFEEAEVRGLAQRSGLEVVTLEPERFEVHYGGTPRLRERWRLVARKAQPGV